MTAKHLVDGPDGPSFVPENDTTFRLAQLLLLLEALQKESQPPVALERLAHYDFVAANPFLIVEREDQDHAELVLAGFDDRSLSYASSSQRFTSRRERLQHDLSLLVAYGLSVPSVQGGAITYAATIEGRELAARFTALYARSYLLSASIVIRRLRKLSDSRLRDAARRWVQPTGEAYPAAMLDLFEWADNRVEALSRGGEPVDGPE